MSSFGFSREAVGRLDRGPSVQYVERGSGESVQYVEQTNERFAPLASSFRVKAWACGPAGFSLRYTGSTV